MYKEGIPIQEIASRRGLTMSTVETHLASFIFTGEIAIGDLVPKHKIAPILSAIKELGGAALGPIRGRLGDDYSFGEIRAVLTHLKHTEPAT
jgi:ATP-dependent DNA helicase RecQ